MLVDTSVWVEHFRRGNPRLAVHLQEGEVMCHPFVIGELACGALRRRAEVLSLLTSLPQVPVVQHEEALALIEANRLMGTGIGWVDVHLLASSRLAHIMLWTLDRRLGRTAASLGIAG
ncbi:MAG: type II toxin-antitoxin system VapC family toxin [Actinomycetota bacterium]|nr:type II toxin-antitoxin system VapC family toxin [Actinomycetota bacterium]